MNTNAHARHITEEIPQKAVNLSPDILAVIEKTRIDAEEEMNLYSEPQSAIPQIREKATFEDVLEQLAKMQWDVYKKLYEQLKKTRDLNLKDDTYPIFEAATIRWNETNWEEKLILIRKMLDAWALLKPSEDEEDDFLKFTYTEWRKYCPTTWDKGKLSWFIYDIACAYDPLSKKEYELRRLIAKLKSSSFNELKKLWAIFEISYNPNTKMSLSRFIQEDMLDLAEMALKWWSDPRKAWATIKSALELLWEGRYKWDRYEELYKLAVKSAEELENIDKVAIKLQDLWLTELWIKVKNSLSLDARDSLQDTPFIKAIRTKDYELQDFLIKAWASISSMNTDFETPLMLAVRMKDEKAVEIILSNIWQAQLEEPNPIWENALNIANKLWYKNISRMISDKYREFSDDEILF